MKKALYAVAVIATVAIAGWNYQQNKEVELSDLAMENVEALASGEIDTPTDCPGGLILCAWIHDPWGSVTYYKK